MSHNQCGWCSNRECPCWTKPNTKPCHEWFGYPGTYRKDDKETWPAKFCLFCGFERKDHKSLIHNGGKR